jgi:hypothetical protein
MRGNNSWAEGERPKSWLETLLYNWPNGDMPLTGMTSKLGTKTVDDHEFNWWEKGLPTQSGDCVLYEDLALSNAFTTTTNVVVVGDPFYAKVALKVAKEFRPGHTVALRDANDASISINAKVVSINYNGDSSSIGLIAREATTGDVLEDVDLIQVIGNANPQGGAIPQVVSYQPTKINNFTQIFWTPYQITNTAKATRLRTKEAEMELKREALQLHGIEMERALIWGKRYEGIGDNGEPETETMGLVQFINEYAKDNVFDYTGESSTDYLNKGWTTAGSRWLNEKLEILFRYGGDTKLLVCGSGALLGINRLAETFGQINISPGQTKFGISVREWETPFGVILLKTHPLFSQTTVDRYRMVAIEPGNIKRRPIKGRDTRFYPDSTTMESSVTKVDAVKPSFLTEVGFELHHASHMAIFDGVGQNNGSGT